MDLARSKQGSDAVSWLTQLALTGLVLLLVGLAWLVLVVWLATSWSPVVPVQVG